MERSVEDVGLAGNVFGNLDVNAVGLDGGTSQAHGTVEHGVGTLAFAHGDDPTVNLGPSTSAPPPEAPVAADLSFSECMALGFDTQSLRIHGFIPQAPRVIKKKTSLCVKIGKKTFFQI